jgi:hypothetical protein
MSRTSNGRGWAYVGTTLGGAVSLAANAAHSYVAPAGAPATWRPHTGAIMFAVFWPIALFVAIEMLARVRWRTGALWVIVRYVGLGPVAVVAAIVSYQHLSGLLATYGENRLTVVIGPLAVDGLMVLSAAAVMATSPAHQTAVPETSPEQVSQDTPETPPEQPGNTVPKPRKRTTRKTGRKTAPARPTEEQLIEAASALNEAALGTTGEPVSLRKLKTELRIGHPTAVKLRDAVIVTAPETAPEYAIEHTNGSTS